MADLDSMVRWLSAVLVVPLLVVSVLAAMVVENQNDSYRNAVALTEVATLAPRINQLDQALGEEALAGRRVIDEPSLWEDFVADHAVQTDEALREMATSIPQDGDPAIERAVLETETMLGFRSDISTGLVSPLQLSDRYARPRTRLLNILREREGEVALDRLIGLIEARSAHLDERFSSELALTYGTWAPGQYEDVVGAIAIQEDRIGSSGEPGERLLSIDDPILSQYRDAIRLDADLAEVSASDFGAASDTWLRLLNGAIERETAEITNDLDARAAAASQARWLTVLGVMFGVLLAFLGAGFISYRMVDRVGQIADFARRLATGERPHQRLANVVRGRDELAELALVFDEMAGEVRQRDQRLAAQAQVDHLTKILNRKAIIAQWNRLVAREDRASFAFAIDLDGFKPINDRYGHHAGDRVLIEIASRLQHGVDGHRALVGRLGGDEFLAVFDHPPTMAESPASIAADLIARVRAPIEVDGASVSVEATIGIVRSRDDGTTAADLLRDADAALYVAKSGEGAQIVESDDELRNHLDAQAERRQAVKVALRNDEFEPWLQSVWDRRGRLVGFEALARWCPRDGDVRPTSDFIEAIESQHLLHELDAQILRKTCEIIAQWSDSSTVVPGFSVNVSTEFLEQPNFVSTVQRVIREAGVDPSQLTIEITESGVMADFESSADRCQELRAFGVRIAVDDYGAGYSSLSYLRQLPVDFVKLDRQFVSCVDTEEKNQAIARSVIALTRDLGMQTVVEGVEREGEREWLASHGADFFQGYLFGRPVPVADAWNMINGDKPEELVAI